MVGLTEFGAALGSLKAAKDIVAGIASLKSEVEVNQVKVELQRALIEAFGALSEAQHAQAGKEQELEALRKEIQQLLDWSEERKKYALTAIAGGAFAYMPRSAEATGEPAHWLCASCFDGGRRSIMQPIGSMNGDATWQCPSCKSKFVTHMRNRPIYVGETR
jgi:rubrerythrin